MIGKKDLLKLGVEGIKGYKAGMLSRTNITRFEVNDFLALEKLVLKEFEKKRENQMKIKKNGKELKDLNSYIKAYNIKTGSKAYNEGYYQIVTKNNKDFVNNSYFKKQNKGLWYKKQFPLYNPYAFMESKILSQNCKRFGIDERSLFR